VLQRLLGGGVLLAMDNFGTGLSPLGPPANFEFDMIKLDPSIVAGVLHRGKSQTMARIALLLGQELGSLVVAQGIETREQLEQLQLLGFNYGQGRFLAAPMPADGVTGWLELQRRDFTLGVGSTRPNVLH
jgi:EAL domain-containing protein (putative c-di-GMP-specific phosphodiesterase class I)